MDPQLCRICLSRAGAISVFSKESDDIQYSTKIMRLITVDVSEDDGLPSLLCDGCVRELSTCYQFVMKCEASDKALRCVQVSSLYYNVQNTAETTAEDTVHNINSPEAEHESDRSEEEVVCNRDLSEGFSPAKKPSKRSIKPITKSSSIDKTMPVIVKKRKRKMAGRNKKQIVKLQCLVCEYVAMCPSALETHIRIHTGEKPFVCEVCNTGFRTRGALKRHSETFHSKRERKFVCEMCGNSFFRKSDIIAHLRVHTDERPYVCPYCPKKFRQIASMIRHRRTHTGEKPYACTTCGRKFADSNLVRRHQSVHTDEKHFQCHLCPKMMKSRDALNTHVDRHTKGKTNFCTVCGMAFTVKGNLTTHMKRMHSEKSGKCTVCHKTCSDLEVHMRKHTGEKPFVCEICNAAFSLKRCLAHHMLFKHENSAKYKCSVGECTMTFPTATMLEFHLLKQHTNHTPYICKHCSKGFFRPSDLSRHLKVVHMDMPKTPLKSLTLKLEISNSMYNFS